MSRHITLWDKVGNEIAFIVVGDVVANTERVTTRELLAIDLDRATINPYPEPQEPMYDAEWAAAPYDHAYHERRATDALCTNAGICPSCGNDHSVEDCEF